MRSSEPAHVRQRSSGRGGGIRFYFSVATLATFAVISLLFGIVLAGAGNFIALRYCLLFTLLIALVIAYSVVVRYRRANLSTAIRTVERHGTPGTEIRSSAWQFAILLALTGCGALLCGMAAIEIVIHQDEGFPGSAVIAGALGLIFGWFGAGLAFGRIRRGGVILSRQAIVHRAWSFESRLDWPEIAVVTLANIGYAGTPVILVGGYANANWVRRYTTRLWRIDRLPKTAMLQIDCRQFDVDPHVLYGYVRTYVDNPELRGELGTEAALTRARS
ncbi:hypothetical protein [Mycolicibacterium sp. HK-90]|uniref:hypothetical protein n=1 Tax=Mycolicibacterium sp. HK-90 TaxID=3056937 RepID=UPI002657CBDB|nr:hypothetical protein [Mycolicibacterium sp. HK-90]WKG05092.1 hypothetical protein QU592_08420 [Mycolicibacterium sp. HK-90]